MKPYASYKPSGVEWLGDVPGHWEISRIKYLICSIEQGWSPQCENFPVQSDNDWGVLKVGCVNGGIFNPEENKKLPNELQPVMDYALKRGDLLISRANTRDLVGSSAPVPADFANLLLCDKLYRLRLILGKYSPEFVSLFLGTPQARSQIELDASGASSSMLNIGQSAILDLKISIPPFDEQQAIADYLDTENARIDTLVQEKEELIGLLREAQASAFAATVLRFATAAAGVKCNRFAWLDSLPTSWRIAKVKHLTLSVDQGISPQCESRPPDDGEWGVLKVGCVNTGDFNAMESKALPNDIVPIEHITLLKGDVLISRANTKNLVGRAAMADKDYPRLMLSDKHYRLRLDESECLPQYLVFVLTHRAVRVHIEERATGASASMLNIDRRTIMDLEIPLPPVEIQDEIVREVQADREALARLITHTQEEIALLKELRAATIADAVLGRVDVRSLTQKQ